MSGAAGVFRAVMIRGSDRRRLVLLILAAWVAGLAIAAMMAGTDPADRSSHRPVAARGGTEQQASGDLAGRRWQAPVEGRVDPDGWRRTIAA